MSIRDLFRGGTSKNNLFNAFLSDRARRIQWHHAAFILLVICSSIITLPSASMADTYYRKPITIDHTKVTYDGAFQFYYKMEDADYPANIDFLKKGKDIHFTDQAGNELPFERIQNINGNVRQGVVMELGAAGSFDSNHVLPSMILKEDGVYKLWYTGYNGTIWSIGYATSPDGIAWTKQGKILDKGSAGQVDSAHVLHPSIIKDGDVYKMWYSAHDGTNWNNICYATSTDGITWTKQGSVMQKGGTYENGYAYAARVIKNGETYKMWYCGYDGTTNVRIHYATSADGLTWVKHGVALNIGSSGSYDSFYLYYPFVVKDGDEYKMWYVGWGGTNYRIMYANSQDGQVWVKQGLWLDIGTGSDYDTAHVTVPFLLQENGSYRMWFSGMPSNGSYKILYAPWKKKYEAFVRIPNISSTQDTQIYMVYGGNNPVDKSNGSATFPASDGFNSVYHLNNDPSGGSGCIKDSTANARNATPFSMAKADLIDGKIGKGLNFRPSAQTYIETPNLGNFPSGEISTLCWARSNQSTWNDHGGFLASRGSQFRSFGIHAYLGTNTIHPWIGFGDGTYTSNLSNPVSNIMDWHYYALTYSSDHTARIYDDNNYKQWTGVKNFVADTSQHSVIGHDDFTIGERHLDGAISELWVMNKAVSIGFQNSLYNNQSSSVTFYSLGNEETYQSDGTQRQMDYKYFPLQLVEHKSYSDTNWNPDFSFSSTNSQLTINSTTDSMGSAYAFVVLPKADLTNKSVMAKISNTWPTGNPIVKCLLYDGEYSRSSTTDFPSGFSSLPLKGNGMLQEVFSLPGSNSNKTMIAPLDASSASSDNVTLFIYFHDAWNGTAVSTDIHELEILNADGSIYAMADLSGSITMNHTGSYCDYGLLGRYHDLPDQYYDLIFQDDFESGNLVKWSTTANWSIGSSSFRGSYAASHPGGGDPRMLYVNNLTTGNIDMLRLRANVSNATNTYYPIYNYSGSGLYFVCFNNGHFQYYDGSWHNFPNDKTYSPNVWYTITVRFVPPNRYQTWVDSAYLGEVTSITFTQNNLNQITLCASDSILKRHVYRRCPVI